MSVIVTITVIIITIMFITIINYHHIRHHQVDFRCCTNAALSKSTLGPNQDFSEGSQLAVDGDHHHQHHDDNDNDDGDGNDDATSLQASTSLPSLTTIVTLSPENGPLTWNNR